MMPLLADANVNGKYIKHLQKHKSDKWEIRYLHGREERLLDDEEVENIAREQGRAIVTCDKDFDKFRQEGMEFPNGVLWLRFGSLSFKRLFGILEPLCSQIPFQDLQGNLFEVTEDHLFIRPAVGEWDESKVQIIPFE